MAENKYTIKQVAKWFASRELSETNSELSYQRLQKLLFYAKSFGYVFLNDGIFETQTMMSNEGPVFNEIAQIIKEDGFESFSKSLVNEQAVNDKLTPAVLNFVYEKFFKFSEHDLIKFSMKEIESITCDEKLKIDDENIKKHFRQEYLCDEPINNYGITRDDVFDGINYIVLKKYEKAFKVLAK